ncbi:MAG TPA: glycerophosphodiester phosphodiesterase family protein [Sporichthyaceae bacterium]|nr:glycerophosphodiester phosphodiesterase family protein [Sporichthyaceae bacterium]
MSTARTADAHIPGEEIGMYDVELKGATAGIRPGRGRSGVALGVKAGLVMAVAAGSTLAAGPAAQAKSTTPSPSDLQIVAHRGGDDWGTVNALNTLTRALNIGADAIEFDVHFTKDHRTVVMHDDDLAITTNCSGSVADITYDKLRKSCKLDNGGGTVPNIYEVLKMVAQEHKAAYVHVKVADNLSEAKKVVRAINKYHLNDGHTVTTIASSTSILRQLKLAGSHRRGYVFNTPAGWDANYSVLLPFNVTVTRALVKKAQDKGRFVAGVEGHPMSLAQVPDLHLNAILANNLDRALLNLGKALADVNDQLKNLTGAPSDNSPTTGTDGA